MITTAMLEAGVSLLKDEMTRNEMDAAGCTAYLLDVLNRLEGNTVSTSKEEGTKEFVVDPKAAIRKKSVSCCLCGKDFTVITEKHLQTAHGMSKKEYLQLCGYPAGMSLSSKEFRAMRKQRAEEIKPWEKSEIWQKSHSAKAEGK